MTTPLRTRLAAVILGAIAFVLVLVITDYPGPGLDPDALSYLGAAESVAQHGTYTIPTSEWFTADSTSPLAHFPPGFPTALALPIRLGATPLESARLVEGASAFITAGLIVLFVSPAASLTSAVLLVLALFAMTSMHEVHVSVLSEPLYFACMMSTLALLAWRPDQPWRAGIAAAAGAMTRYVGVSLVGVVVLWTLTRRDMSWPSRIRHSVIAVMPAVLLEAVWVARTRALATEGAEQIRTFAVYGGLGTAMRQGGSTILAWLLPDPTAWSDPMPWHRTLGSLVALSVATLALIGFWWLHSNGWKGRHALDAAARARNARAMMLLSLVSLAAAAHLGIVFISRALADPAIPFDERILSPALLLAMVALALLLTAWFRNTTLLVVKVGVAAGLCAWWWQAMAATRGDASYALEWGSDLAGVQWRTSELLAWSRSSASTTRIYSNWPSAVWFHEHRPARELPHEHDARTLREFGDTLRARKAYVLMFNTEDPEFATRAALLRIPGIAPIAELRDGVVLAMPAATAR